MHRKSAERFQNGFKPTMFFARLLPVAAILTQTHPACAECTLDQAFAIYYGQANYVGGEAAYTAAIKANPLNPRALYMTAIGYERQGNFDLARRYYFRTYYAEPGSQTGKLAVAALARLDTIIENPEQGAILLTTGPHTAAYDMILADFAAQETNRQIKVFGSRFPNFKVRYVVADNEWPQKKSSTARKESRITPRRQSPYNNTYGEVSSNQNSAQAGLSATAGKLPEPTNTPAPGHSLSVNGKLVKPPKRP